MGGKDEDGGVTDSEASSADHQGRGNTCLTLHSPQDSAPEAKEKRRETRHKSVSHESDTRKMPLYLQTTKLKVSGSPWLPGCIAASPAKGQLLDGLEMSPKEDITGGVAIIGQVAPKLPTVTAQDVV